MLSGKPFQMPGKRCGDNIKMHEAVGQKSRIAAAVTYFTEQRNLI